MPNFEIHKKVVTLTWGGFCLVWKSVQANNGRWQCIWRINSSMRIKNIMWLCVMGRHNLTNQWADLIAQHLKCCYGHSEMPGQSLSSKYFCIIASQNCYMTAFPNSRHPPPKAMTACIVFRLLKSRHKSFFIYENYYIQWLLLRFFVIFSVSLSGSDDFVIFPPNGNGAYSPMFYATFKFFTHKLNSQL